MIFFTIINDDDFEGQVACQHFVLSYPRPNLPPLPLQPTQEYMVRHAEAGAGGDEEDKVDEDGHEDDHEDAGDDGDDVDGDDVCGDLDFLRDCQQLMMVFDVLRRFMDNEIDYHDWLYQCFSSFEWRSEMVDIKCSLDQCSSQTAIYYSAGK